MNPEDSVIVVAHARRERRTPTLKELKRVYPEFYVVPVKPVNTTFAVADDPEKHQRVLRPLMEPYFVSVVPDSPTLGCEFVRPLRAQGFIRRTRQGWGVSVVFALHQRGALSTALKQGPQRVQLQWVLVRQYAGHEYALAVSTRLHLRAASVADPLIRQVAEARKQRVGRVGQPRVLWVDGRVSYLSVAPADRNFNTKLRRRILL